MLNWPFKIDLNETIFFRDVHTLILIVQADLRPPGKAGMALVIFTSAFLEVQPDPRLEVQQET